MKIKATERFKDYRFMCLPEGLSFKDYRALKGGKTIDTKAKIDALEVQGLVIIINDKDEVDKDGNNAL